MSAPKPAVVQDADRAGQVVEAAMGEEVGDGLADRSRGFVGESQDEVPGCVPGG